MKFSSYFKYLKKSKIQEILNHKKENVLDLASGDVKFKLPKNFFKINLNRNLGYCCEKIDLKLKEKIVNYEKGKVKLENIFITNGVLSSINIILSSILNPGETVLIPKTCFGIYKGIIFKNHGVPIELEENENFSLDIEDLKKKINFYKPKVLILNNPSNSTGKNFTRKELKEIVFEVKKNEIYIISDEVYSNTTFNKEFISIFDMYDNGLSLKSFTKFGPWAGIRFGWILSKNKILLNKINISQVLTSYRNSIVDKILVYDNFEKILKYSKKNYLKIKENRTKIFKFAKENSIETLQSQGTHYFFLDISSFLVESQKICEIAIENDLLILPGTCFNEELGKKYIRINISIDRKILEIGLKKLKKILYEEDEKMKNKILKLLKNAISKDFSKDFSNFLVFGSFIENKITDEIDLLIFPNSKRNISLSINKLLHLLEKIEKKFSDENIKINFFTRKSTQKIHNYINNYKKTDFKISLDIHVLFFLNKENFIKENPINFTKKINEKNKYFIIGNKKKFQSFDMSLSNIFIEVFMIIWDTMFPILSKDKYKKFGKKSTKDLIRYLSKQYDFRFNELNEYVENNLEDPKKIIIELIILAEKIYLKN